MSHEASHAVEFSHVSKRFDRAGSQVAIADLDFKIRRGEHVCVVGRSGCGKSTSVNLILGLIPASGGAVRVLGVDPYREFGKLRGRVGCVFQTDRLLPWRTALDNVLLPLEVLKARTARTEDEARALLAKVGLQGHEDAYPHHLSGGMRQRVAVARALITHPDLLIADEAFGHLDEVTAAALRRDFHGIAKSRGQTVIQITHSLDEALEVADRILVFDRPGRVVGTFQRPQWSNAASRSAVRNELRSLIAGAHGAGVAERAAAQEDEVRVMRVA